MPDPTETVLPPVLPPGASAGPLPSPPAPRPALQRRGLLAAVGGLVAALLARLTAAPAQAQGTNMLLGLVNHATGETEVRHTAGNVVAAFVARNQGAGPGLYAYAASSAAVVAETSSGPASPAVYAYAPNGNAVYGLTAGGIGVQGNSTSFHGVNGNSDTGWGVYGHSNSGLALIGISESNWGVFGECRAPHSTSWGVYGVGLDAGVRGYGRNAGNGVYGVSEQGIGVRGRGGSSHGVLGECHMNPAPAGVAGVFGSADYNAHGVRGLSQQGIGVFGETGSANGIGVYGKGTTAGWFDGTVRVVGALINQGNFSATGTKSALVPHPDGTHRRLYCVESPESWFEDFGEAQLANGQATVALDPEFAAIVHADRYHVFLTEYESHSALYVVARTPTAFTVKAQVGAGAIGRFSYRVVAKRKDVESPRLERVTLPAPPEVALPENLSGPLAGHDDRPAAS